MNSADGKGHRWFAFVYSVFARFAEKTLGPHRKRLLDQASGRVAEIGAGTGMNFKHYPPAATEVLATEPNPHMFKRTKKTARAAGSRFTAEQCGADALGLADASVDDVVSTLVLCSVADPAAALAEVRRVLKPGGRLLFFEHVRAPAGSSLAAKQDKRERMWGKIAGGCHPNRDTEAAIRAAGFDISDIDHFDVKGSKLVRPHILGVARKAAS